MGVNDTFAVLDDLVDRVIRPNVGGVVCRDGSPRQQVGSSRRIAALPQVGCRVARMLRYRAKSTPVFAGLLIRARAAALPMVTLPAREQLS